MNFSLIILAGGKSSRMGTDKGLMLFNGRPMIEHITKRFKNKFQETIIVSENNNYEPYCDILIADNFKNTGPLGGIEAGLSVSNNLNNIILSCDNPLLTWEVIDYIISNYSENEIVFSKKEFTHPFPSYFNSSIRAELITHIKNGIRKITHLEEHFNVLNLDCSRFSENNFINFNCLEDIALFHENNT